VPQGRAQDAGVRFAVFAGFYDLGQLTNHKAQGSVFEPVRCHQHAQRVLDVLHGKRQRKHPANGNQIAGEQHQYAAERIDFYVRARNGNDQGNDAKKAILHHGKPLAQVQPFEQLFHFRVKHDRVLHLTSNI